MKKADSTAGRPGIPAGNLSPLERSLYACMLERAGNVITRDELLKSVWGFQAPGMTRTVDMCVRRLRGKIGSERIRSVYGKGYVLVNG